MKKAIRVLLIWIFGAAAIISCDKEPIVPQVPVNIRINLDIYNELLFSGNFKFLLGGYGGIIVICVLPYIDEFNRGEYYAFDATCTYEVDQGCTVKYENDFLQVVCPCCGSQYSLYGGTVMNPPASYPLHRYNVSVYQRMLRIYN